MIKSEPITHETVVAALREFEENGGVKHTLPAEMNPIRMPVRVDSAYENIFEGT